ncbi:MAG: hypothetical protein JXR26_04560 [Balneolaceae bacterium]|nr:hypothetical protein [Balneolaceae bacterium]
MLNTLKISSIGLLSLIFLVVSCSDNLSSSTETPPELPPAQSMQTNFSLFDQQQTSSQPQTRASENFNRAFGTALIMKAVVDFNLAIPRALLAAASNAGAELNESEEWEWNYSKQAGDQTFGVRLVASGDGDTSVNWNFYVTNSELGLSDQLFFSGTTSADGREGTWVYYDLQTPDNQEAVSEISWSVTGDEEVALRLDVVSDRNENEGDYLEYTFDNSVKSAVYYNADENEITKIEWNVETKVGYIISPDYNNGQKACWDTDLQDVTCSEI